MKRINNNDIRAAYNYVLEFSSIRRNVNELEVKTCEMVQHADNTVLFASHCDTDNCIKSIEAQ